MLAVIPSTLKALPDRWRSVVRERRELTSVDPAADAFEKAATELEAAIAQAQDETRMLTTEQYARVRGIGPGTVRKWCIRGEIPGATLSEARKWLIPASAIRAPKRVRR